ncbi:sulfotransferase ssu-1-like isoform X3 [Ornithodoros turicata]|uniref:sulfotransferase ssu-1-like isoform X3 n=1 Tax=Ornithodoros turicata TaxID=34597 RepID=UPI0031397269
MKDRDRPFYKIVNGHRIPGAFSEEVYLSGLTYKPLPTDVILNTFPKCGTHWVFDIIKAVYQQCRGVTPGSAFLEKLGLAGIESAQHPRIVFTHLPYSLTPHSESTKYIYVTRNPKDCCVSFYHHTRTLGYDFKDGSFDEYFDIFVEGLTDFGSYYESLTAWYAHRDDPNVLFLTYESIHADVPGSVLKIAEYLEQDMAHVLKTDEQKMKKVLEAISFENMKKDLPLQFVRKGVVGDWRNYFSEEQSKRLEERFFEEVKGTDIPQLWKDVDWLLKA